MRPDLVIFDCDGVLVDSEGIANRVIAALLTEAGMPMSIEECIALFMGGSMSAITDWAAGQGTPLPQDWIATTSAKIRAALAAEVEPVARVGTVLDWLDQEGIPYAVASNGSCAKMQVTLGRCGFLKRFEGTMYSAPELGRPKPAPDVFLHAAKMAGVVPQRAVVIEDSKSGMRGAKAAGMTCFAYLAHPGAMPHSGAIPFLDMADLPDLLGHLKTARVRDFDWHSAEIRAGLAITKDFRITPAVRRFLKSQYGDNIVLGKDFRRWVERAAPKTLKDFETYFKS